MRYINAPLLDKNAPFSVFRKMEGDSLVSGWNGNITILTWKQEKREVGCLLKKLVQWSGDVTKLLDDDKDFIQM